MTVHDLIQKAVELGNKYGYDTPVRIASTKGEHVLAKEVWLNAYWVEPKDNGIKRAMVIGTHLP